MLKKQTLLPYWIYGARKNLERTLRWGIFHNHTEPQSVLQHIFNQIALTELAIVIEKTLNPTSKLNFSLIQTAAWIHDLEERPNERGYDVSHVDKNNHEHHI